MSSYFITDWLTIARLYMRQKSTAGRRIALSFLRVGLSFSSATAHTLLVTPKDLYPADPSLTADFYAGNYVFNGQKVECGGQSPFKIEAPSYAWTQELHSFSWLRHMRATQTALSQAHARALIEDWITSHGRYNKATWTPSILAHRVTAWLCHSDFILEGAEGAFKHSFLTSLARQLKALRTSRVDLKDAYITFEIAIARAYAALCIATHEAQITKTIAALENLLDQQILPDGGHKSRNPQRCVDMLALLLPLRDVMIARNIPPSSKIMGAIDRITPMVRFLIMQDGYFTHFNGVLRTPHNLINTVLGTDANGTPLPMESAPHSGYYRLDQEEVTVFIEAGAVPAMGYNKDHHAGCLSFEMVSGAERIVINCGRSLPRQTAPETIQWTRIARSTAAHSTLSLNKRSSCRFIERDKLAKRLGTPILSGPKAVEVTRSSSVEGNHLSAVHDGYVNQHGIKHRRSFELSLDGARLTGTDRLLAPNGTEYKGNRDLSVTIRFHLHPDVAVSKVSGSSTRLTLQNGESWLFSSSTHKVDIDASVALSPSYGRKRTLQLFIEANAKQDTTISWLFQRLNAPNLPTTNL